MKKISLFVILVIALYSAARAQVFDDALQLTLREQSTIFLDAAFYAKMDSVLSRIREKHDTLKTIHAFVLYEPQSLLVKTGAEWSRKWYEGSLMTGDPFIDAINSTYFLVQVDTPRITPRPPSVPWFRLVYNQPLKMPLLAEFYVRHPDVLAAEPNFAGGDGNDIEFVNKQGLWHFAFSFGAGDCPAGCMDRYYWYVTFDWQNQSVKLEEARARDFTTPILFRWNIPDRYAMTMFTNATAVFDSIRYSPRWWVRRHAIEGIKRFFENENYPWCSEDANDRWQELKSELFARQDEIVAILTAAANDPDKDVAESAAETLQGLQITAPAHENPPPARFALLQNYPNPFNSTTTIRYDLPNAAPVTLIILNLHGERMATLVDQRQEKGEHKISWRAEDFASGVYFCRMQVGQYLDVRKLVLVR